MLSGTLRNLFSVVILVIVLIVLGLVPATAGPPLETDPLRRCETGILDAGENGLNVLTYEYCQDALTVGFQSSEIIERMSCGPRGTIRLWLMASPGRCSDRQVLGSYETYELLEPLRGLGRSSARPVRQLLTCPAGSLNTASIVVPDARAAILDTRRGDTLYEKLARRFVADCVFRGS